MLTTYTTYPCFLINLVMSYSSGLRTEILLPFHYPHPHHCHLPSVLLSEDLLGDFHQQPGPATAVVFLNHQQLGPAAVVLLD